MKTARQTLGRWGETQAARYLETKGFTVLEQNARTPYGEIDLVVQKDDLVVFVEVKTRRTHTFGNPEESVNFRKQLHLKNSVEYYIQNHPDLHCDWRIDVIAIQASSESKSTIITHFENAVS